MADLETAVSQLRAIRQVLAEYADDEVLQIQARAIDCLLDDESTQLADGRISMDLSTFGVGRPWPIERVFYQVLHKLKIDPTYYLLLLSAAVNAGANIGEVIKFADCIETMRALADAANIDLSEMEVIAEEGDKAS